MKLKFIFGIMVPIILIILFTIIGSLNYGVSIDKSYIKELHTRDFYENGQIKNQITVGTITITNNYILPKRIDFPASSVCLIDNQGVKPNTNAGYVGYSDGDQVTTDYSYSYRNRGQNLEVESGGQKTVSVFIYPQNIYAYGGSNDLVAAYGDYDEAVLIEDTTRNSYTSCTSLSQDQLDSSVHIQLLRN